MNLRRILCAAVAAALVSAAVSPCEASCGSANCFLVTGTQEGLNSPGQVTLDLSFKYLPQDRMLRGSRSVDEVLVPKIDFENRTIEPDHHREISTLNLLGEAGLNVGVTKRSTVSVVLPLYVEKRHEHFDEVGTPEEHFTNADGTSGFGDVRVLGRYALIAGTQNLLIAGAGIKVPTGAYKLRDGEGSINEPGIQPGSGATDYLGTLHYVHQWIPNRWEYFLSGTYQLRGENSLDYRFGSQTLANAGVRFSPGSRLVLSLQLNGQGAPHDSYRGQVVDGTGSRQIALTPGITIFGSSGIGFYAHVAVPVYQKVNESQLVPRTALAVGLTGTF
ncbi:MAG TPA: hypothetical protein VGR67_02545 [Candidatus Polarisedimenticolia bacterium]|jgi:hypothetical protein|nr:hypothetical protein [Candidatus Polarisedimenticolia bacterium]